MLKLNKANFLMATLLTTTSIYASSSEENKMHNPTTLSLESIENISETKLSYLDDTYKFESTGTLLGIGEDTKKGPFLVFDETIFYPQGGGQPSDIGSISFKDTNLNVNFASFVNGRVCHFINEKPSSLSIGDRVAMKINQERRITNAKSHTAGHLVGTVVESIAPELTAAKGYHFPEGPYVEFEGKLTSKTKDELVPEVNEALKHLLEAKTMPIKANEVISETLKNIKLPKSYKLPEGKKLRVVQVQGYPMVPCGGTHLKNLNELKYINIKKANERKGILKLSYSFL